MYGAGNFKLGSIVYDDFTEARRTKFNAKYPPGDRRDAALARLGKKGRDALEQGLPALGKLQQLVKKAAQRGFLKTHDGGRLKVRSQHAALNTLLQGGGAVVMKKSLVIFERHLRAAGYVPDILSGRYRHPAWDWQFGFCANVHDEFQMECDPADAPAIAEMARDAIRLAGESFGMQCPLAGAAAIGQTWADTH